MYVTDDTFARAVERIARCTHLTVDLETTGLDPYHGDRLFGVAVEAAGEGLYFPFRHKVGYNLEARKLPLLLDALVAPGKVLLGHNLIRFDGPMMAMEGERYERAFLHPGGVSMEDTMIDAMLANENELSFSLDALSQKYLGQDVAQKNQRNAALMEQLTALYPRLGPKALKGHMSELPVHLVAPYALGDVFDCRALKKCYDAHHADWQLEALAKELYDYARLLARIEWRGLYIDRALCERRVLESQALQDATAVEIRRLAGPMFNPNSPPQVCRLLGTADAKKETVARSEHPVAQLITRFKKLGKVRATYYEAILRGLDANNMIHPRMNLTRDPTDAGGTRTGRLSCSNPNFQNLVKRAAEPVFAVRQVVLPRPGYVLLPHDYERAEMWMGGGYSGDSALYDAYHAGRDLYAELAQATGITRYAAKVTWLAIQYGAGAWKLSELNGWAFRPRDEFPEDNSGWDEYNAQQGPIVRNTFFKMCPGIKQMMNDLTRQVEDTRCLRLWTGRVRHFDGVKSKAFSAWNGVIQGAVGEMVRIAMQRLEQPLDDMGSRMLLQVHDEVLVEAPEEQARRAVQLTSSIMTNFNQFPLRPRVEPGVGLNYHDVQAWTENR